MLYSYFFNMLKVGVPGATQVPQLLVYNPFSLQPEKTDGFSSVFLNKAKRPPVYTGAHKKVIPKLRLWHLSDGVGKRDNGYSVKAEYPLFFCP